jgi:beta-mannosidase
VLWQLNDCWPSISWAIVDVSGRRKPSWYAVRAAYRDRLAAFAVDPAAERPHIALINDHAEPWRVAGELRRVAVDGTVRASVAVEVPVRARGASAFAIPDPLGTPDDPRAELLVLDVEGNRDTWWFVDDDELATTPPELEVTVTPTPDGATVEVRARTLARELCLLVDHVMPDATVDEALVTLMPGESATFRVTSPAAIPRDALEALGRWPVLRAANDLVGGGADRVHDPRDVA